MTRLARLSARVGRRGRRAGAVVCLLLAAASALTPDAAPAARSGHTLAARLWPGEVAVPVAVSTATSLVQAGDHVGVVAAADATTGSTTSATLVADRLRVLSVRADDQGLASGGGTVVVLAARRSQAVSIARFSADRLVLIVDDVA